MSDVQLSVELHKSEEVGGEERRGEEEGERPGALTTRSSKSIAADKLRRRMVRQSRAKIKAHKGQNYIHLFHDHILPIFYVLAL